VRRATGALALAGLAWGAAPLSASAADPVACPSVIDTLDRLAQMMPGLAGNANALIATMLLPVSNSAHRANAEATAAGWSQGTLDALIEIATNARAVVQRELPVGAETAALMETLAIPVVAEAETVCTGYYIPRPMAAG
jgi:hypothetical protein